MQLFCIIRIHDTLCIALGRAELAGPPESGSSLPVVDTPDIEAVVAAWTGLPVERMGQDEKEKLVGLVSGTTTVATSAGRMWGCSCQHGRVLHNLASTCLLVNQHCQQVWRSTSLDLNWWLLFVHLVLCAVLLAQGAPDWPGGRS
jgi:hypothetical protein